MDAQVETESSQNETEVTVTMKKHKDEVLTIEDVSEEENATVVVVKNTEDNVDAVTVVEVEAAEPDASKTSTETNETEEVVVEKSDSGEVTKTTTKTVVVVDKNAALEDQSHSTTSTTKTTTVTSVITKSECNPEEKTVETEEVVVVVAADKAPLAEVEPKNAVTVEEVKKDGAKETQQVVEEEEEEEEDEEEEVVYEEEESDEEEVVEEKKTDQTKKFIVEEKELGKKELKTVDQVPQGEDAVDKPKEPSPPTESSGQPKDAVQQKKNNIQNAIKEIISDIDSDINEENIAILKKQQMELLKQQQDLAQQIRQQQQLAQQLAAENQMHQQQLQQQQKLKQQQQQQQQQQQLSKEYQLPQKNISKYSTYEESKDDAGGYTCKSETFESSESSNVSKKVDLHKIFTPATDVEEILPKNRKLYSSSAFYSPTLHPTVEDQVELARRISHSLSDTNNQKSKGQSMYVNRKKRSVKWVHEGSGQDINDTVSDIDEEGKENTEEPNEGEQLPYKKLPLRLIMNPRGQMRDIHSEQDVMNFETGLLSPDKCAEVVNDLQAKKGRGAELFAKRRRKSEKWIVDETNAGTQSPSGLPDLHQYQPRPPTSPSMVPAYSDAGKHRVQLNMHQEQLLEKYAKPDLKVVKTPWEAALETGSASAAFVEDRKPSPYQTTGPRLSPSVAPQYHDTKTMGVATQIAAPPVAPISYDTPYNQTQTMSQTQYSAGKPRSFLQRDLAYKPSVAQGWKAPSVTLPKDLYVPKEIPFGSYAPPPEMNLKPITGQRLQPSADVPPQQSMSYMQSPSPATTSSAPTPTPQPYNFGFPVSKPSVGGFGGRLTPSAQSSFAPPKQQQWAPTSYQKVPQTTSQNVPPVSFNPSPLPYDKLAKFENPEPSTNNNYGSYGVPALRHLSPRGGVGSSVRNLSPTPFGRSQPCVSPKPSYDKISSPTGYAEYNNNNSSNNNYGSFSTPEQSPRASRLSHNDLIHGQTFNNSARGWKSGAPSFPISASAGHHHRPQMAHSIPITTSSLPYTDF